ncbi:MAG: methionine aminopeptidase [Dermatophilaceae bacterium]
MKHWFNVETGEVEESDATSRKENLLGPYDTREEAQQALETARKRTEAWDEEDRRWKGDEKRP